MNSILIGSMVNKTITPCRPPHTDMSTTALRGAAIWLVTSLFLVYQNLLNTMFGLVAPAISRDLAIDAVQIGLLAAAFGYAYGAMQIPVGVLFDRLSPRGLLTAATLACTAGALLFAQAEDFGAALAARTLMGLGGALAYVGASTLMALWWPSRFALALGLVQLVDSLGSAAGQPAMAALSETVGWRRLTLGAAVLGAVLVLAMWVVIRRPPGSDVDTTRRPLGEAVRSVVRRPLLWLAALYAAGTIGTIFSYGVVWNVVLQQAFGNDLRTSAGIGAWLFIGFGLGGVGIGWLSERRLLPLVLLLAVPPLLSSILIALLVFLPPIGSPLLVALATAGIGIGCGASVVAFEIVASCEPPDRRGTAIGFVNAIAFFGAAGLQALHGLLVDDARASIAGVLWIYPLLLVVAAAAGVPLARRAARAAPSAA